MVSFVDYYSSFELSDDENNEITVTARLDTCSCAQQQGACAQVSIKPASNDGFVQKHVCAAASAPKKQQVEFPAKFKFREDFLCSRV
jgi:hypothetical protein